ncbi:MAG: cyclase family protein [Desulfuromonadaceae bacterium]|jgi:arylformamidase
MALIDISVTLSQQLPQFPDDPDIELTAVETGSDDFQLTRLRLGSHAGTHLDAPAHLLKNGATIDDIPLATLIGPCRVLDLRGRPQPLAEADFADFPLAGTRRLLLRTDNSQLWDSPRFVENFTGLSPAGARYLASLGIELIGIDYLSIEPYRGTGEVHRILLERGVVILEGLDLHQVPAGDYELICLPLKLSGLDGAPCRAILRSPASLPF